MVVLRDRQSTRRRGRRAFTLVEILVVIAIIGILLTGITIASFRALAGARVNQTRSTIEKIDKMLSSRAAAFDRAMTGRNLAGGDTTDAELLTKYESFLAGTAPGMQTKRLYAKFFGMSFGESVSLANTMVIPGLFADLTSTEQSTIAGFDATKHRADTENPEMLYWFLMKGPTFGSDYQTDFNSSEVADTDGDGLLEFVDAWGKPIRFYRWPTRLLRPAPAASLTAPSQGTPYFAIGPADASGTQLDPAAPASILIASLPSYATAPDEALADPSQRSSTPLGQDGSDADGEAFYDYAMKEGGGFSNMGQAAQRFEVQYHTPNTWHAPLIVSAGPDGVLGLFEPTDRANFGHLAQPKANAAGTGYSEDLQDNVTNLNGQASTGGGQ